MILNKVSDLIGNTPMLGIDVPDSNARLLLKIEKNNPGGSIKDRMARNMVLAALKSGKLKPGGVVVESSSGNTGIGLAMAAVEFDLHFIAVVDHHAAQDKIAVMKALGAEIRLSPALTAKTKWPWWSVNGWRPNWLRRSPARCS